MRNEPIQLGIMAYQSRSLPWAAQRCINWYAESAPALAKPKTPVVLLPRPALSLFATLAFGTCRGTLVTLDVFYAVAGNIFCSVSSAGVVTSLGTIDGAGPVTMASNGLQITIVSDPKAWVYTLATAAFLQITDPDFPGSKWVTQSGGYFVHVLPGNSGQFFLSNLLDGLTFDALNFATAEMDADSLLAAVGDHGELWLFGELTIEPWGNTGASDFPFSPIASAKIQRGCAAQNSIARQDNSLFWVGDDLCVYRAAGYTPQRVSTHAIEKALTDCGVLITQVIGCGYTQDGHSFYQITLPGLWTFVFDNATQLWHERQTFGKEHWQANFIVPAYGKMFAGHENGNIYELTFGAHTDAGAMIRFKTTGPCAHANTAKLTMSRFQVDLQSGVGLTTGQGSDPQIMLTWSDDGGRTWSSEHWRSMGAVGAYRQRAIWRRLGQFYSRIFSLEITDPVLPILLGSYADMDIAA